MSKVKTISVSGGAQYAKVNDRMLKAHNESKTLDIKTDMTPYPEMQGILFKATIVTEKGTYTGHSFGKIGGKDKALEKLETIAVGRALGFAGYLADGSIASYEEIKDYHINTQKTDKEKLDEDLDSILS